jgi:hypothetical protein
MVFAQLHSLRDIRWGMIVKEVNIPYFNALSQYFPGRTEENDNKIEKLFGL